MSWVKHCYFHECTTHPMIADERPLRDNKEIEEWMEWLLPSLLSYLLAFFLACFLRRQQQQQQPRLNIPGKFARESYSSDHHVWFCFWLDSMRTPSSRQVLPRISAVNTLFERHDCHRKFLDGLASNLGLQSMEDWHKVKKAQVIKEGGSQLLKAYGNSLFRVRFDCGLSRMVQWHWTIVSLSFSLWYIGIVCSISSILVEGMVVWRSAKQFLETWSKPTRIYPLAFEGNADWENRTMVQCQMVGYQ